MKDISQTKEGFIKSMILFVVLLGICFAPFIAFAKNAKTVLTTEYSTKASTTQIDFDLGIDNNQATLTFKTGFVCNAYTVEARMSNSDEYTNIFYCHDAQCLDANTGITYNFWVLDYPYDFYRVKTIGSNGDVIYSEEKQMLSSVPELELLNNTVNETLYLKASTQKQYTYSISNIKGTSLCSDMEVNTNLEIDLIDWKAGFYIINFKSVDGKEYHYTFLKQ